MENADRSHLNDNWTETIDVFYHSHKYSMTYLDEYIHFTLSDLLKTLTAFSCRFFSLYIGHVFCISKGTEKTGFNLYIVSNWKIRTDWQEIPLQFNVL